LKWFIPRVHHPTVSRKPLHQFTMQSTADPVLPAGKCVPAQSMKKKADRRLNQSEQLTPSRKLFRGGTGNLVTQKQPSWAGGDMSASSLIFTLVLLGTILAGHTDHPMFWLLVGPAPLGIGYTAIMVFRRGLGQNRSTSRERHSHGIPSHSPIVQGKIAPNRNPVPKTISILASEK
jgi:hypothetical protein